MTIEEHNERLVLEKAQAQQAAHKRLGVLGMVALRHGDQTEDGTVILQLESEDVSRVDGHHVTLAGRADGGLVVTVRPVADRS
ncbi:MAG: hypothetical protein PVG83_01150 [Acidimicrobiia bacterium]|jgi:hypothetical protein